MLRRHIKFQEYNIRPLPNDSRDRGGLFFCLDTKEPKDQVSREASLPHGPSLQSGKTWAAKIASQMLLCPAAALPEIVLPNFARSLPADGLQFNEDIIVNKNEIKSGQRPAGKRGPGCFALWAEGFFRLDVWLLCI